MDYPSVYYESHFFQIEYHAIKREIFFSSPIFTWKIWHEKKRKLLKITFPKHSKTPKTCQVLHYHEFESPILESANFRPLKNFHQLLNVDLTFDRWSLDNRALQYYWAKSRDWQREMNIWLNQYDFVFSWAVRLLRLSRWEREFCQVFFLSLLSLSFLSPLNPQ